MQASLGWMESADAKIARAREHGSSFREELQSFYRQIEPKAVPKVFADGRTFLSCWVENAYPPPIRLSILFGDWAFNLRSSLNSLVCGLVRRKTPASLCDKNKFPIYVMAADYEAAKRKGILDGIPAAAVKAIDALQPCARMDGAGVHHPLLLLNRLRNSDTHSSTLFTVVQGRNTTFQIEDEGVAHTIPVPDRWDLMSPLVLPAPPLRSPAPRVIGRGSFELCFRDTRGPWEERGVVEVMDACSDYVDKHVVPVMLPFFLT